jgi:hypothetical protein
MTDSIKHIERSSSAYAYLIRRTMPVPSSRPDSLNEYTLSAVKPFASSEKQLKDAKLLELLILICCSYLKHRHSHVCKNTVFSVYTIFRELVHLVPDAPELVQTFPVAKSEAISRKIHLDSWRIV